MSTIVKNTILNDVVVCYRKGCTAIEIANKFNVSNIKVRKLLISAGIVPDSDIYHLITNMYKRGFSVVDIAAKYHISVATVNSYLPYSKCIYNMENVSDKVLYARRYRQLKNKHGVVWGKLQ